jgi:transcriptional regulator GlxA family with amidase domain
MGSMNASVVHRQEPARPEKVTDRIDGAPASEASSPLHCSDRSETDAPSLTACLEFIHRNMESRITLEDLSAISGGDRFKIIRMFRSRIGTTPHAYIIRLRVSRAAELLRSGEPAAEVASEVGFVDQSHLIRYFKRHFGVTPKKFVDANGARRMIA